MKDSDKIKILKPTADALFEIAKQAGKVREIYNELEECANLFRDKELYMYFTDDRINIEDKKNILNNKIKNIFSNEVYTFIIVLIENKAMIALIDIIEKYKALYDEYNNIVRVKITTSEAIDENTTKNIITSIKNISKNEIENKEVVYTKEVDSNILGGIIVQIDSVVYDYSIRNQINKMYRNYNY